jgi:hypothetical protein
MRSYLLAAILISVVVLGCIGPATPICNKPYILVGTECCLDNNNNSICDGDDSAFEHKNSMAPKIEIKENITQENGSFESCSGFGCMADKPKYCPSSGKVIYACETCGCATPGVRCDVDSGKCTETCINGTKYGECTLERPFYCSNGELIDNCAKCGCDMGLYCRANGKCSKTPEPIVPNT